VGHDREADAPQLLKHARTSRACASERQERVEGVELIGIDGRVFGVCIMRGSHGLDAFSRRVRASHGELCLRKEVDVSYTLLQSTHYAFTRVNSRGTRESCDSGYWIG